MLADTFAPALDIAASITFLARSHWSIAMASTTKAHEIKKKNKSRNLGKAAKKERQRKGSTPSKAKLFGDK